jgi:hypothetical protein
VRFSGGPLPLVYLKLIKQKPRLFRVGFLLSGRKAYRRFFADFFAAFFAVFFTAFFAFFFAAMLVCENYFLRVCGERPLNYFENILKLFSSAILEVIIIQIFLQYKYFLQKVVDNFFIF